MPGEELLAKLAIEVAKRIATADDRARADVKWAVEQAHFMAGDDPDKVEALASRIVDFVYRDGDRVLKLKREAK
jgi:hypothetical protein